ncbi:acyl-CoA thioesterase/bile acid-CoA:amino acid N-acyltransferase family protein [Catenulispora rubra]|uniref:acyl-CoA thioesterase/bile acid-CoA:amino acid N-acyltransferase family protein n=1 Tax=Catenulispora rubra TaxID=280293 RepID=UPI001892617F|nr:acyl-CoA thioesterase/bile acid-CoA:amino acid N-acyltransferase family protein [Catenulispora rubra]
MRRWRVAGAVLAAAAVLVARYASSTTAKVAQTQGQGQSRGQGQGLDQTRSLRLTADQSGKSAFDPVVIRVTGAVPGSTVTLSAWAIDADHLRWTSAATFHADASGTVDLAKQAPISGSYGRADEMGLLWSMNPPPGSKALGFLGTVNATVTASDQGMTATLLVSRHVMAAGETSRVLTVAHDGVEGHFYEPPAAAKPRPAVITLGGSEGGEATAPIAMALAAEGYPALSVGYFDVPGTPAGLKNVPLEYFAKAAMWLAKQPNVDASHILIWGASRGSEAALLTAQNFPALVHGAILYSPSAEVNGSYPAEGGNAWILHGAPVAALGSAIPVNKVDGPVLAFAGDSDLVWSSGPWANQIMGELDQAHDPYPHTATVYRDAGHFVDAEPYMPALTAFAENGREAQAGGTRQADAAAQGDAWQKVLKLLAGLSR